MKSRDWHSGRSDGLATISAGHDETMYGPSSTVAFLRHVMPAHGSGTSTPTHHDARNAYITPDARGSIHAAPAPDRMVRANDGGVAVLPMRRSADNFVSCFGEFVFPMFPVIHRPSFLRKYERLWVDNAETPPDFTTEAEEATFTSTLNLVFALGCKFSSLVDAGQKASVADNFYQRSRQAYPFDILDSTSVSLVQMLLLTGVYLQSTEYASRCWNVVGLAIRMAMSLGLHVDNSSRKATTQVEREMRRRIWHTCVTLDRLLAMTFGRPSMIDKAHTIPIPAMIDDDYLSDREEARQPPGIHSRLGLFVYSCKLFEILEDILDLFYRDTGSHRSANGANQVAEIVTPVLDFNRRLDSFLEVCTAR